MSDGIGIPDGGLGTISLAAKDRQSRDSIAPALNPRSIAIIGASDDPHKIGGRPVDYLSRFAFQGRVYPINPNRSTVQGFAAYPNLAALPETLDLAIIATPAAHAMAAVDACAVRGVRVAIVMSSGFGEAADGSGAGIERDMVSRARAAGMRVVGPNSQGLASFHT